MATTVTCDVCGTEMKHAGCFTNPIRVIIGTQTYDVAGYVTDPDGKHISGDICSACGTMIARQAFSRASVPTGEENG